ncbi:MAG TPA: hypothetical protein GXX23_02780 [Firmicutes bacterium]|nr:hypothetical protein [Candidatus Fermentithermobacillaceae bacterium]
MIHGYLNQTAKWKKMTSSDGYPPQPEEPGTEIKVRWEGKRRLVRNAQGVEVVSEARVFCVEDIKPGDVLEYGGRDWPVIAVSETPGLDGKAMFREVAV